MYGLNLVIAINECVASHFAITITCCMQKLDKQGCIEMIKDAVKDSHYKIGMLNNCCQYPLFQIFTGNPSNIN